MPKVTVIIATYNWSTVLPYSIGSVLRQSFEDFECLVVGDGCTDDSEQVVNAISDERVHWHNLAENYGQSAGPHNEGLRLAQGEIIAYLGHDDLWLPHHLETLMTAMEAGFDFTYSFLASVREEGQNPVPVPFNPNYYSGKWLPPTAVAHRLSLIGEVGNWPDFRALEGVDAESDLWRRIHEGGYKMTHLPRVTAIKFPAARRKGVYKERPCHEQKAWTERIEKEADLEAKLAGQMMAASLYDLAHARKQKSLPKLMKSLLSSDSKEGKHEAYNVEVPSGYSSHATNRRRIYKGLEPKA